jgi:hypothetical protein
MLHEHPESLLQGYRAYTRIDIPVLLVDFSELIIEINAVRMRLLYPMIVLVLKISGLNLDSTRESPFLLALLFYKAYLRKTPLVNVVL